MNLIGDLQLFVVDLERSIKFWSDGLQLRVVEKEITKHSGYARLEFPDSGQSIRLFGPVNAWESGEQPEFASRPMVSFDIVTEEFEVTLSRLIDAGGAQVGEIEEFDGIRTVSVVDPDDVQFELIEMPPEDEEEAEES